MNGAGLLVYALIAIIALIVLITRYKLHPFVALLLVSVGMGIAAGMSPLGIIKSFQTGVGGVLGFIAVVVALGTMLGKLLAESGAAERIARTLIEAFGQNNVHWALMAVAFIIGVPVFFQVGFVLMIPLVFTIARQTGLPLLKLGLSLVAGLSVVHGIVPPHPAAMLAVSAYHANVGLTVIYALIVALPAAALAGPVFGNWIAKRVLLPVENAMADQLGESGSRQLPGFWISLATILMPVGLMIMASWSDLNMAKESPVGETMAFVGNPIVALLLALLLAFYSFGARVGFNRDQILKFTGDCLGPTAGILLVIGAGGGFNQVLLDSGVGGAIADLAVASQVSPLVLAFLVSATIRVATGSATVALTAGSGIVAPIAMATPGLVHPELLVLATGSGSLILSHVNDAGFWLIKEYFNMTVQQTLKTWTVLETILSVSAFLFTMILSKLV